MPRFKTATINVVFDGPPSNEGNKFIEVEDMDGKGVSVGDWVPHGEKYWALRLQVLIPVKDE